MKKLFLFSLFLLSYVWMYGQYAQDFASYTVGDLIGQDGWVRSIKAGEDFAGSALVVNQQLSYPGYIHSAEGKAVQSNGAGSSDIRVTCKAHGQSISTGNAYYFAFKVKFSDVVTNNTTATGRDFFIASFVNTSSTTSRGRVFVRKGTATNTLQFTITKSATPTASDWSGDYILDQTHLLVVKFVATSMNSSNKDAEYHLIVDPIVGSPEPAATKTAPDNTTTANTSSSPNFAIKERGDGYLITGIRVADNWADAVKSSSDPIAPAVSSLSPANGASNISLSTNSLLITFNKAIDKGTGNILVRNNGSVEQTIDVTSSSVMISGMVATINMADLTASGNYTVEVPSGAFANKSGVPFAGIASLDWAFTAAAGLSSDKGIHSFSIPGQVGSSVIDNQNHTVTVHMPFGTNVTSLVPAIGIHVAASIDPLSGTAQNFTNPFVYNVVAEDNSSQAWTVTVIVDPNTEANIKSFDLPRMIYKLDNSAKIVTLKGFGYETSSISSLSPTVVYSVGASSDLPATIDLSSALSCLVTAQDGISKNTWEINTPAVLDGGVATLPISWDGTSVSDWENRSGNGLIQQLAGGATGTGYNYASFNAMGSQMMIHFDSAPEQMSFYIRTGNVSTVVRFAVEESADGESWSSVAEYVNGNPPTGIYGASASPNAKTVTLSASSRYVRFNYLERPSSGGTNVYIDKIRITKGTNVGLSLTDGEVSVWSDEKSIFSSVPGMMEVFNLQGVCLVQQRTEGQLDLGLKHGVYWVKFSADNAEIKTLKIFVR